MLKPPFYVPIVRVPHDRRAPLAVPPFVGAGTWAAEKAIHCGAGKPREPYDASGVALGTYVLVDGALRTKETSWAWVNVAVGLAMIWVHGTRWAAGDEIDCRPYRKKRCRLSKEVLRLISLSRRVHFVYGFFMRKRNRSFRHQGSALDLSLVGMNEEELKALLEQKIDKLKYLGRILPDLRSQERALDKEWTIAKKRSMEADKGLLYGTVTVEEWRLARIARDVVDMSDVASDVEDRREEAECEIHDLATVIASIHLALHAKEYFADQIGVPANDEGP